MILCAPGKIPAKTVVDEALGTVDFAPTILPLLGFEAPDQCQGRDFRPLLAQEKSHWNDITFLRNAGQKAAWIAGVTDRFKLVISTSDSPWLFDMKSDPDELANAFGRPENAMVEQRLAQALLQYGADHHDPFLNVAAIRSQLTDIVDKP